MEKKHMLYVTVYCSAISPCGNYLVTGNNFGYLSIFNLNGAISANNKFEEYKKPIRVFKGHPGPIHSLLSTAKFLISAGDGPIIGWKWSDILSSKITKSWTLSKKITDNYSMPKNIAEYESYNSMTYNARDDILISGGNDCNAVLWDLKTGIPVETFSGHTDYIHDTDHVSSSLVTAAEDGCVKVWDVRACNCINTIEPYKSKQLSRPHIGKWISCVSVDGNGQWIACGGGPQTSLWHIRSGVLTSELQDMSKHGDAMGFTPNTIAFYNDEIIAGGNQANLHRWYVNGQNKAVIPCTISNIFSLSFKTSADKTNQDLPIVATGTSSNINIFTNLGYLGMSLSLM